MCLHKLTPHQVNPQLLYERVSELGSEVNGCLETLGSAFVFMQLSINTAAFAPQLARFGHFIDFFPPNLENFSRGHAKPHRMNPFCNQSACIAPFFGSLSENVSIFEKSIMEVVLPVTKLIVLQSSIGDVLVPILFDEGHISRHGRPRAKILPPQDSIVYVP